MEKIILFGTGQMFDSLLRIIEKVGEYEIEAVWDNNTVKQGSSINIFGKNVIIEKPHDDTTDYVIVITSTIYEAEMRNQLLVEFGIPENRVKPWNYCLKSIKLQIVEKYAECTEKEIVNILEYLKSNELDIFNNENLKNKYELKNTKFEVNKDVECGLFYSWWKGKKIYLKRSFTSERQVQSYLNGISQEQDTESPHCYSQIQCEFFPDDVIVDGGAAEGFFALENVELVKKIYIVEGDKEWVEALKYTFEPYKDKVEIIPKWLSGKDNDDGITLEELGEKDRFTVLKLDIEGAEEEILNGAISVLQQKNRKRLLVCVYHNSDDAENIKRLMTKLGYKTDFTKGYLFFPYDKEIKPELRKGLLVATKY